MKRIFLTLAFILITLQSQATIALVTGNITYNSGGSAVTTSGSITISPSVTVGQYLVVSVASGGGYNISGANLELVGAYSTFGVTATTHYFALYRALGTCSGFTVTQSSSIGLSVVASVFSSTQRLRIDTSGSGTGSSTAITTGTTNATTNSANELWIGTVALRGVSGATFSSALFFVGSNISADNTYYTSSTIGTTNDRAAALWYKLTSSTGQPSALVTASSTGAYAAIVVCIEETPGEVSYNFSE